MNKITNTKPMNDVLAEVRDNMDDEVVRLTSALYIRVRNDIIRKVYAQFRTQPVTQVGLSALFGMTQAQISRIVNTSKEVYETK